MKCLMGRFIIVHKAVAYEILISHDYDAACSLQFHRAIPSLYDSETWILYKRNLHYLDHFHLKCL